jgi:hypothetical protein
MVSLIPYYIYTLKKTTINTLFNFLNKNKNKNKKLQ